MTFGASAVENLRKRINRNAIAKRNIDPIVARPLVRSYMQMPFGVSRRINRREGMGTETWTFHATF